MLFATRFLSVAMNVMPNNWQGTMYRKAICDCIEIDVAHYEAQQSLRQKGCRK